MPNLMALLQDPDPEVVQSAVLALGAIDHPGAVATLIRLLDHDDPGVRYVTEQVLIGFGSEAVVPLIASLKHVDVHIQEASARILGKIKDPSALPPLLVAFGSPFPDRVRIAATIALGDLGDERAVGPIMEALYEKASPGLHEIPHAIAKIGSVAVEPLIRAVEDTDLEVARLAAKALGEIKDERTVEFLIRALEKEDPFLSRAASDALISIGEASVIPLMQAAAANGSARQVAVTALIGIGAKAVPPLFIEMASDPTRFEDLVMDVVPAIGVPAVEPLMSILKEDALSTGDLAVRLLSAIGSPAVPFLKEGLKTDDLAMRIRCVKALGEIGDEKGIAPLMKTLGAEEPEMREVSAEALAKIGKPAVSPLIQAMEDPESPVQSLAEATLRKIGAPAVESLIRLLNRADVHIEETVTGILIETGASAVPGLIEHLSDPDPVIQSRCSDILVKIGELAVFPLVQLVEIQDPDRLWRAVKALTEIGNPAAIGALMGVVFHRSPEVRYFAVQGLGKIKDPKAIPALVDSLPDRWAGHQAAAALAGFGWQPKTQAEQLYYDLALSNRSVTPEATQAREILLSDLRQGDFRKREFALHALMELFQEAIVSELIRILQTEGSQELGILFIESGFKSLEESGLDWLKAHAADAFLDALGARLFWNTP